MIHNTKNQALELKQCRIVYSANSYDFKTDKFEEMVEFINNNEIPAYISAQEESPNVTYLDALILCKRRKDYLIYKSQLERFEYRGGEK